MALTVHRLDKAAMTLKEAQKLVAWIEGAAQSNGVVFSTQTPEDVCCVLECEEGTGYTLSLGASAASEELEPEARARQLDKDRELAESLAAFLLSFFARTYAVKVSAQTF